MAQPPTPVEQVSQVGIDDFSFRRGRKFGTIVVDLQTHQVLDVLPDRTAETSAAWMQEHPEIEIVSRDRGGDYAAAARQGAFDALPEEERKVVEPVRLPTEFVAVENWKPAPDACVERARLNRRAQRQDRYEQVTALRAQGLGNAEIARRVGSSARTLRDWQKKGFPEAERRRKRSSRFDSYASYVLSRWEQGCQNGSQIYREIKEQGYTGTERQMYRFLVPLRRNQRIIQKGTVPQAPLQDFSAKDAVWLFVRDPAKLDEKEQATLTAICQASETAKTTYQLVQEFRHMLHHREGSKLDDWLEKVRASQIRELQRFVTGVERDKSAVVAGLTLSHNNGLVEGKVNKLKLIKRMGYGRAGFALLRQRVLHAL